MEIREYITNAGDKIMLPATDERVMTLSELADKYAKPAKKQAVCPKCHSYCYGDCKS